jgi:hypothetical protein
MISKRRTKKINFKGSRPPANYTWHHHQDGKTMLLVPKSIHNVANGGFSHMGWVEPLYQKVVFRNLGVIKETKMAGKVQKLTRSQQHPQYGATHPINDEQWHEFEKMLGKSYRVPGSYKQFMYLYNGGVFDESVLFSVPWGPIVASTFFPLFSDNSHEEASVCAQLGYFTKKFGQGYIPFADDPGGNYYLLGCGEKNADTVYFWNHEDGTLTVIFDSFEDFLAALMPDV